MLKFKVKNLGRISSAEVELAPLTILVGKNNTGKSYLATLIWALGDLKFLNDIGRRAPRPAWFNKFLEGFETPPNRSLAVNAEMADLVVKSTARELNRKAEQFLSRTFAYPGFAQTTISLEEVGFRPFSISIQPAAKPRAGGQDNIPDALISIDMDGRRVELFSIPTVFFSGMKQWLSDLIYNQLLGYVLFGSAWRSYQRQIYIPAARTGVMLALPSLVSRSLASSDEGDALDLPRPLSAFLQQMARPSRLRAASKVDSPMRERLREKLVCGQITSNQEAVPEFRYTPAGAEVALPLHATSSMITELAPLMVALEGDVANRHIIFEEPEAHLHLEAQREMARFIARLVSGGAQVTLTTHSDTFLQQINNLMTLHGHQRRDQLLADFKYDAADLIDPAMVRAYEFCPLPYGTEVRRLDADLDGFVVPTLNETLMSLARETIALGSQYDG